MKTVTVTYDSDTAEFNVDLIMPRMVMAGVIHTFRRIMKIKDTVGKPSSEKFTWETTVYLTNIQLVHIVVVNPV